MIPNPIPKIRAMESESEPSKSEFGKVDPMSSFTVVSLYLSDGPKSPRENIAEIPEILFSERLVHMIFFQ